MQSADRTRSKRWRSGTRRNKRYHTTVVLCSNPAWCLVHATVTHPKRPPAMAMRLTRCEQKWVDDVRANRPHVHIKLRRSAVRRSNSITLLAVQRRMYASEGYRGGNLPGPGEGFADRWHNPPGSVVAGMDYADPNRFTLLGVGRSWGKAAAMENEVQRQQALGYDVVQYGRMDTASSPRMRNR